MRENPKISTFYSALVATGVINDVMLVEDENYNPKDYEPYYAASIWDLLCLSSLVVSDSISTMAAGV